MADFRNYYNNSSQRLYFESHYEDVSEPLKEYIVEDDGSLTETSTSRTLLGVKKNGKWGWVDANNMFVIQPLYDTGFVTCYNGIITVQKNNKWGGFYRRDESMAFAFRYSDLNYAYKNTYVAHNDNGKCALVRPGDQMLTGFNYIGFSTYNQGRRTEYVKGGFFGQSRGYIDLETGREL